MFKKTKIIATIGPACNTREKIKELVNAGADIFRINTSHGKIQDHQNSIDIIKKIEKELKTFIPVMIDLQGPKIRIGNLSEPVELKLNEELCLEYSLDQGNKEIIPVDYPGIANDVKPKDKLLIDDGKIHLEVLKIKDGKVFVKVTNAGILTSRKGLNVPSSTKSLAALTKRDIEFIKLAVDNKVDFIALSFVREKNDILPAKKYLEEVGANISIIAKIEKPQALDNLEAILHVANGVMVARGDLGVEISPEKVPIVQKQIINEANKQRKAVIVATQMLETMIEQPIPTRAEASDIANAIIDGADAIMLSGETAVGKYPKQAVKMMAMIAKNVEESSFCPYDLDLEINQAYQLTPQSIVSSAIKLAHDVGAKGILAFTHSGYSTRLLSKLRPCVPIFAISDEESTCRKLKLYWNVEAFTKNWDSLLSNRLLKEIDTHLLGKTSLKIDDRIIITGSIPQLITGRTNFLRVHRIGAAKTED